MSDDAETPNIDPEAVARAEAIVVSMRGKFLDWLRTTEGALKMHLDILEFDESKADLKVQAGALAAIMGLAHEMRGLGGTFGYPLVTRVGATLEDHLEDRTQATPADIHIIKEHIAAVGDMLSAFANDVDAVEERRLSDVADQLEALTSAV
jgi:hypothetical protein